MSNNGCVICRVADTSTDNTAGATLLRRIQEDGYQDEGTGSTFAALERRGLVLCKYEPGSLGGPILFVQITKAGRKLVRDALATAPTENLPVGTLREWHWRALCRAYIRGEQGLSNESDLGDGFGYDSWNTCLQLRDYTVKGLECALNARGGAMNRSAWSLLILAENTIATTGSATANCTRKWMLQCPMRHNPRLMEKRAILRYRGADLRLSAWLSVTFAGWPALYQ